MVLLCHAEYSPKLSECHQGYWWNDRPTSSASRVKTTATHLFELCIQAGIPFTGPYEELFGDVAVEELQRKGWDYDTPGSELLREGLDVIDWLKNEHLETPFSLESAYSLKNNRHHTTKEEEHSVGDGESIPFTNVTFDFVSVLDYIFLERTSLRVTDRMYVPKSFTELSDGRTMENAHLLPSDVWPSDHLAIGARLLFLDKTSKDNSNNHLETTNVGDPVDYSATTETTATNPSASAEEGDTEQQPLLFCSPVTGTPTTAAPVAVVQHGLRCACGCVPAIPSLFEMAAMRQQARQQKLLSAKQQQQQKGENTT